MTNEEVTFFVKKYNTKKASRTELKGFLDAVGTGPIRKYKNHTNYDDIQQEYLFAVISVISKYDEKKIGSSSLGYFRKCGKLVAFRHMERITRQDGYLVCEKCGKLHHSPANGKAKVCKCGNKNLKLKYPADIDVVTHPLINDELFESALVKEKYAALARSCTPKEENMLYMYIIGYPHNKIAEEIGLTKARVGQCFMKIKAKAKRIAEVY